MHMTPGPLKRKLVVHDFKYMKDREEVFLSGNLLLVKVYAIVAGIEIDFVREFFPEKFPTAFVDGMELDLDDVLDVLREMKELEKGKDPEKEALCLWLKTELTQILEYNMFINRECFDKFTRPLFFGSMPRPAADFFLWKKRHWTEFPSEAVMVEKFRKLLQHVHEILGNEKFHDNPSLLDITLYAFLSPLFAIPPDLTFWEKHNFGLQRVRAFLLDFDDWLWCHAIRPPLLSAAPKLPQYLREDTKTTQNQREDANRDENAHDAAEIPSTPETRKHNFMFGAFCVATAVLAVAGR